MSARPSRPSCPFVDSRLAARFPTPTPCSVACYCRPHNHQIATRNPTQSPSKVQYANSHQHNISPAVLPPRSLRSVAASCLVSQTIKFKSTSLILLLGSSLVPFSQSLLPPSHIGLPFSVPRLCTIKTGLSVCDIWVYLRVVDVARLHWVSIWFRFPLAHGLVHSFLVILVVVNSMDLVYIEQIPFHARSLRHPVDCN